MRLFKIILILLIIMFINNAFGATNQEIVTKYQAATNALETKKYKTTVTLCNEIDSLVGQKTIKVQIIKIKALFGRKYYSTAKKELTDYFALKPKQTTASYSELVALSKTIDKKIAAIVAQKNAEEERIAAEKKAAEAERQKISAADKKRYDTAVNEPNLQKRIRLLDDYINNQLNALFIEEAIKNKSLAIKARKIEIQKKKQRKAAEFERAYQELKRFIGNTDVFSFSYSYYSMPETRRGFSKNDDTIKQTVELIGAGKIRFVISFNRTNNSMQRGWGEWKSTLVWKEVIDLEFDLESNNGLSMYGYGYDSVRSEGHYRYDLKIIGGKKISKRNVVDISNVPNHKWNRRYSEKGHNVLYLNRSASINNIKQAILLLEELFKIYEPRPKDFKITMSY